MSGILNMPQGSRRLQTPTMRHFDSKSKSAVLLRLWQHNIQPFYFPLLVAGLYSSPNLQKVSLKVMDNKTCEEQFLGGRRTLRLPEGVQDTMLCAAGHLDSAHDTCQVRVAYLGFSTKILY